MYFLENRSRYGLAVILGISAFVFPVQAPWTLVLTLLAAVIAGVGRGNRIVVPLVSLGLFVCVVGGFLSASLITAILAALVVAARNPLMALAILGLQTSYFASLEAIISNFLFTWSLEAAGPSLLSGFVIYTLNARFSLWRLAAVLLAIPIVWLGQLVGFHPTSLMILAALPSMAMSVCVPCVGSVRLVGFARYAIAGAIILGAIGWLLTPPRTPTAHFVLLPGDPTNSPEALLYRNYSEVLGFASLGASVVESAEGIPAGSLVLLPWLTAVQQREGTTSFDRIRSLALERGWIVVMIGEHNDMGGVADRVNAIAGQRVLRKDLTVPFGNADISGHMRVADMRSWYPDAMLNRGASVNVQTPLQRVLLSGDGWWAEPNLGEWLWVGDYIWHPGDRNGRLVMAATVDEGRARWVTLGDTGLFLSPQLATDPRAAIRFLELSTLWPLFLKDLALVILGAFIVFGSSIVILAAAAGLFATGALLSISANDGPWRSMWRHESNFDERNFNQALIDSPKLLTSNWKLIRTQAFLSGRLPLPTVRTVIFGLVEDELTVGNSRFSNCKRLGSLSTDGITLMDAQACKVDGDAKVLVGDKDEAAIVKVGPLILIFDSNFLGQKAPPSNRRWLENRLAID